MDYDLNMTLDEQEHPRTVAQIPRAQRERLAFIDFQLYFLGELRRLDLYDRFEMGPAGATRDIAEYKRLAPENLGLDNVAKIYRPTAAFRPLFVHSPRRVLTALSQGFGHGLDHELEPMVRCEYPAAINLPDVSLIAPMTRAINLGKAVRLSYTSVNSGTSVKELVPIALVDIGSRWQVRAFDRKHRQFRDFVLTRIHNPEVLMDSPVRKTETAEADLLWNRIITLDLVPHPDHPAPEIVKMDYAMIDGVLCLPVRAAHAGYILRKWSVDCSPDHSFRKASAAAGLAYDLWLRDPLALYGSEADLAPGYVDPRPGYVSKIVAM